MEIQKEQAKMIANSLGVLDVKFTLKDFSELLAHLGVDGEVDVTDNRFDSIVAHVNLYRKVKGETIHS